MRLLLRLSAASFAVVSMSQETLMRSAGSCSYSSSGLRRLSRGDEALSDRKGGGCAKYDTRSENAAIEYWKDEMEGRRCLLPPISYGSRSGGHFCRHSRLKLSRDHRLVLGVLEPADRVSLAVQISETRSRPLAALPYTSSSGCHQRMTGCRWASVRLRYSRLRQSDVRGSWRGKVKGSGCSCM